MLVTPSSSCSHFQSDSIEHIVRLALELGELSPGAAMKVQRLMQAGAIAERDYRLIQLLRDAIQDGYVQQVGRLED
ncbi:MAG: hypothetical protein HC772_12945 [Leptolyngbyaceae cyanobacterium CRU_2_3]|nr:hypothetical protein [Leptolyngbyaceae cyanobacterium CRU_2_3]